MALQGNAKPEATFNEDKGAGSVEDRDWNSVKRSVCMIDTKSAIGKGTGFVGKLDIPHKIFGSSIELVLVTANHVLPNTDYAQKAQFYFDRIDGEGFCIEGKNLIKEDRNNWKGSKDLDFSLFWIKPDALSSIPGAPIEPLYLNKCESVDSTLASADQLFAIHHPEKPPKPYEYLRCKSAYLVTHVKGLGPILTHTLSTYGGSSGAPLFKVVEGEPVVVAVHAGAVPVENPQVNYAFRMSDIIHFTMTNEMKNKIPPLHEVLRECTGDLKLAEVEPQPRQVAADNHEKKTKESKNRVITESDLSPYLNKLASSLLSVGSAFGVSDFALQMNTSHHNPKERMRLLLGEWIENTQPPPTWETFCRNLVRKGLDMNNLAHVVAEEHCRHVLSKLFPSPN